MPYLTHPSGQKTFYYDDCFVDPWEPKETILIHHGFGRNSDFWYNWIPALAAKYRVIRRDALGHGYSPAPTTPPKDIDAVLNDLVDTLDQLKIDQVHFIGESTGGIFGEFFAARNPERVRSLTIVSSPLAFGKAGQDLLSSEHAHINDNIRALGVRGWAKVVFDLLHPTMKAQHETPFAKWWLDTFSIPDVEGVCVYSDVITRKDFDANRILEEIKVPMLLLAPSNSPLINVEDQKRLAKAIGGQLELIETDGHEIFLDFAGECQKKFLNFAASLQEK